MVKFIFKQWLRHRERLLISVIGLMLISGTLIYLFSLTESTKETVSGKLQEKWESSYDLLVTPPDTVMNKDNLMEPNFSLGINGGISYKQYEGIKSISGIETAAPISVLGYVQLHITMDPFQPDKPGLYKTTTRKTHDNGLFTNKFPGEEIYRTVNWTVNRYPQFGAVPYDAGITLRQPQLIVGIDPKEEAELVGLENAVANQYFGTSDKARKDTEFDRVFHLPVLLNNRSFSNSTYKVTLEKLQIPFQTSKEQRQVAERVKKKGYEYLHTIDTEPVDTYKTSGKELEEIYFNNLNKPKEGTSIQVGNTGLYYEASTLDYAETKSPFPKQWAISYKIASKKLASENEILQDTSLEYGFREVDLVEHEVNEEGVPLLPILRFDVVGQYNPEKLRISKDPLTKLPIQTYRPAEANIVLGPDNEPLNPIQKMKGSGEPTGILSNPPNVLTTVKAAEVIKGGNSISAIRIKVKGIEEIGNAAQGKLDEIKQEIVKQTGLQVTITRGSSPQPTITKVIDKDNEALGWIEQPWIKLGQSITIFREISMGYSSILLAVLLIGTIYVFATSYVSYLANKKDYSIFLALGWRTNMLRNMMILEAIAFVILISLLAIVVEYILYLNGANFNLAKIGLVSVASLVMFGLGMLIPLIRIGKLKPYQGIKSGEIGFKSKRFIKNKSIVGMVVNQVFQRPGRNLLSVLAIALPSTLLSFYLFVSFRLDGVLYTSYLGEFVAVEVNETYYFIMAAALLIGVLTTGKMMWQNIMERQNELAIFKSIGWKNRTVSLVIVLEGALIGFIAGLSGLLLSIGYIGIMYDIFPWDSITILLLTICIPIFIGMFSVLIPVIKAIRTNPYELLKASA